MSIANALFLYSHLVLSDIFSILNRSQIFLLLLGSALMKSYQPRELNLKNIKKKEGF